MDAEGLLKKYLTPELWEITVALFIANMQAAELMCSAVCFLSEYSHFGVFIVLKYLI